MRAVVVQPGRPRIRSPDAETPLEGETPRAVPALEGGNRWRPRTLDNFEEAVAQHQDMVFSFAYYYLGNRQEAEDVTQDVLMRFWRHFDTLEKEIIPKWLNRVTKNRSFDFLRSRTRRRKVVSEDAEDVVALFAESDEPGPHREMEQDSVRHQVRRAVLRLPEPYRSAVIFREILELPYKQTADALEIPLNTAKVHVHRGRRMLRDSLRESGSGIAQ